MRDPGGEKAVWEAEADAAAKKKDDSNHLDNCIRCNESFQIAPSRCMNSFTLHRTQLRPQATVGK